MEKWIEATGRTEDAAVQNALAQLGLDRDSVSVEILERARSGFFGIGGSPAKVKVTYEVPDEAPAPQQEETLSAPQKEKAPKEEPKQTVTPAQASPVEEKAPAAAQAEEAAPQETPAEGKAVDYEARIRAFLTGLLEQMGVEATITVGPRTENGIRVNGIHARTVDILHTGDVLEVETSDHRPPRVRPTPGPWPLPIVWEDGHLLVVNKPAGMTAHASNFLPDTPTVAGALAWQRGADFVFHPVNRLDKGTTGLMVVAKSGYIHDRLRYALHTERFCREYRAVCIGCPDPKSGTIDAPIARLNGSLIQRTVDFASGERSVTHYRTLAHCSVFSHLELRTQPRNRPHPPDPRPHGLHRPSAARRYPL